MSIVNYKLCGFFLILLILSAEIVFAQSSLQHVTVSRIHFHKPVTCLAKAKTEFLWMGTGEGLYRYDGFSFSLINTLAGDGLSLSNPKVNSIIEDDRQNLWIATENGITVINPGRDQFRHIALVDDSAGIFKNNVTALIQSGAFVWFGTDLGYIYQIPVEQMKIPDSGQQPNFYQKIAIPGEPSIKTMIAAADGAIWANHRNELIKINAERLLWLV